MQPERILGRETGGLSRLDDAWRRYCLGRLQRPSSQLQLHYLIKTHQLVRFLLKLDEPTQILITAQNNPAFDQFEFMFDHFPCSTDSSTASSSVNV
jgi:hypothetical protein